MTEHHRISKVEILIEQKKFDEAERILSDLLTENPNNLVYLSLLAEAYFQQDKYEDAKAIINNAVGLYPDAPDLFYFKSRIALQQDSLLEAEKNINQAIELEPVDADFFALLANIKMERKQFQESLAITDRALEIEPENLLALNIRSTVLNKLNREKESFETIEGALREDPNNAYTHANYGWGLLEKGNHHKALDHFKEALSIEPNFGYAQSGMLEAIKASNPIYRLFLKYAFFMSNLTAQYKWLVIFGFFFGFRTLKTIGKSNEAIQPFLTPLLLILALFAVSTWIIGPISNLFLRFNKYGRLLLEKKDKMSSTFVAISIAIFIVGLLLYFIFFDDKMLTIAFFGFTMMIPLGSMFSPAKIKHILLVYTICLGVLGLLAIAVTFYTGKMMNVLSFVYILGFIAFQWIANFQVIRD